MFLAKRKILGSKIGMITLECLKVHKQKEYMTTLISNKEVKKIQEDITPILEKDMKKGGVNVVTEKEAEDITAG